MQTIVDIMPIAGMILVAGNSDGNGGGGNNGGGGDACLQCCKALGLLANLKETREVKLACRVEAKYYKFYLRSNGCDTRNGN